MSCTAVRSNLRPTALTVLSITSPVCVSEQSPGARSDLQRFSIFKQRVNCKPPLRQAPLPEECSQAARVHAALKLRPGQLESHATDTQALRPHSNSLSRKFRFEAAATLSQEDATGSM